MSNDLIAIDIEINADDVVSKLDKLKKALKDKMLMEAIGSDIALNSRRRIASRNNTAPDGSQWESLAASTIRAKQRKGKGDMGILMQRPWLLNTIAINPATLTEDSVSVGSIPNEMAHFIWNWININHVASLHHSWPRQSRARTGGRAERGSRP